MSAVAVDRQESNASADETPVLQRPMTLFDAVAKNDYNGMIELYATNTRQSVVSFLSMKRRWGVTRKEREPKSEEKLDEFLQHVVQDETTSKAFRYPYSGLCNRTPANHDEDPSYSIILRVLAEFLPEKDGDTKMVSDEARPKTSDEDESISAEADRRLWEAAFLLSTSRPPSSFVIYDKNQGDVNMSDSGESPPLFDGTVANATPAPLGAAGGAASGGFGTILHLACAMDAPLALAVLLVLGGDPRAPHTAFRRLMIHEAACSGSIHCLRLLLELGQQYKAALPENDPNLLPYRLGGNVGRLPLFPISFDRGDDRVIPMVGQNSARCHDSNDKSDGLVTFISMLKTIQDVTKQVESGQMTEMDAARFILAHGRLPDATKFSLARVCSFSMEASFYRIQGYADGHGNTPLHWAAFKNETECVSLLLQFDADPNARAHPSGWTPLHDAAYSNSSESLKLLLEAGAQVDTRAHSGATPLCFAAQEDAAGAAKLLLEYGADLGTRCAGGLPRDDVGSGEPPTGGNFPPFSLGRFSGYTPLHYCAHYNAHRAARVLLAHSTAAMAMEIPDLSDRLAIHVAVVRGSSDVLRELLHAGARIDTTQGDLSLSPSQLSFVVPTAVRPVVAAAAQETPSTPTRSPIDAITYPPVSSPVLRAMIPARPITSSKPWNCLSQQAIDECCNLISQAEQHWTPERHVLFTPTDRRAVLEVLRVGKRLELMGTGIFVDLWPLVLSFCGRGWFDVIVKDANETENQGQSRGRRSDDELTRFRLDR